jgi:hypothetical protein
MTADKPTKPARNPDELSRVVNEHLMPSLNLILPMMEKNLSQAEYKHFARDLRDFFWTWFGEAIRNDRHAGTA